MHYLNDDTGIVQNLDRYDIIDLKTNKVICTIDEVLEVHAKSISVGVEIPNTDIYLSGSINYKGKPISMFIFFKNGKYYSIDAKNATTLDEMIYLAMEFDKNVCIDVESKLNEISR